MQVYLRCSFKLCQFTHTTKKGEEVAHRQEVENRGHLLPAIISTDRTIAHREFMKPLEDSESSLADMENMKGVEEEDNYSEDSESDLSYDEDKQMRYYESDFKL